MGIPLIGVPVVKNTHWVKRLIASVDHPVENFCIVNNNGRGEIDAELDELVKQPHPFIQKMKVVHMPANLGVAGSWNLLIKCYMLCPYWVIVNDDVAFGAGFLAELERVTNADPEVGIVHGYKGDFNVGSWDLFLIRDHIIARFGLFDENLYPAYNEDADYFMRFIHRPIKRVTNIDREYYHGPGKKDEYYIHGSQTSKADTKLKEQLDEVNRLNIDYLSLKWGPEWRICAPTPNPSLQKCFDPVGTTGYDLNFVRRKHLGF